MKTDLSEMTRAELEKLQVAVAAALVDLAEKDKMNALAAAEKAAAAHGFTLAEITGQAFGKGRKAKGGVKPASVAKYRNPADPNQSWTGKGRQPEWFKTALAKGMTPETLEI